MVGCGGGTASPSSGTSSGGASTSTSPPSMSASAETSAPDDSKDAPPKESHDDYPNKPIKIVETHAVGGSGDTVARIFMPWVQNELGVPMVIENMVGAGGNIAREYVWKAPPDGYTLLMSKSPSMDGGKVTTNGEFEPMEFEHVFNITGSNFNASAVRAESPYQTLEDLVEAARQQPGKLTVASCGIGCNGHITLKLLEKETGTEFTFVPFNSGEEAIKAALGGQTDAVHANLGSMMQQVRDGSMRVLAVFGEEPDARAPDLPTAVSQGINVALDELTGVYAPPGTPQEIVMTLANAFNKVATENPDLKQQLANANQNPSYAMPDEFRKRYQTIYDSIMAIADVLRSN